MVFSSKLTNDLNRSEQTAWYDYNRPYVQVNRVNQDDAHVPGHQDEQDAQGQDL